MSTGAPPALTVRYGLPPKPLSSIFILNQSSWPSPSLRAGKFLIVFGVSVMSPRFAALSADVLPAFASSSHVEHTPQSISLPHVSSCLPHVLPRSLQLFGVHALSTHAPHSI